MGLVPVQSYPTEVSTAGDFARQLSKIVGPAYTPQNNNAAGADMLTWGDTLTLLKSTQDTSINQAFSDTATDLLGSLEYQRGIPAASILLDSERQTILTAKIRSNFSGSPNDIITAVKTLVASPVIFENLAVDVQASDPAAVFLFAVTIPAADWGSSMTDNTTRNRVRDIVQVMKPAHTNFNVATKVGFLFDDPDSLFDRDLFGA